MASGAFLDTKTALLLTPLVSSTCTLLFAWDQHFFLSLFQHPEVRETGANTYIPVYFRHFFAGGLPMVVSFLTVTTSSIIASVSLSKPLLKARGSLPWYTAGAALALGHLLYVPAVYHKVQAISENKGPDGVPKGLSNLDFLGQWLDVNFLRMLTTDLGAWICCFVAVSKTLGSG